MVRYDPLPRVVFFVQLLSHVRLFVTPQTAEHQASLSFTISRNLLKLMSTESVMPSKHLILCHPLLLLPSSFPSIRVFSSCYILKIRQPVVVPVIWPAKGVYLGVVENFSYRHACCIKNYRQVWRNKGEQLCFYRGKGEARKSRYK